MRIERDGRKEQYTYADLRIDKERAKGTKFRFINTHLESFSAAVRTFQAGNLTSASEITDTGMPTVLVGDLNSDPDSADAADGAAAGEVGGDPAARADREQDGGERPDCRQRQQPDVERRPSQVAPQVDNLFFAWSAISLLTASTTSASTSPASSTKWRPSTPRSPAARAGGAGPACRSASGR